jgi:ectoine hydroxylase-related dioxygenase (phytanoyl-CoA dioxygenase family)
MWCHCPGAISAETVRGIVGDAVVLENVIENRHFVEQGKKFFTAPSRRKHLQKLALDIKKTIDFSRHMEHPVIQHAYLLYKSPGGPPTHLHQDRPYWVDIEEDATMITLWIFLEDIDLDKGCLKLNEQRRFTLDEGYLFNREQDLLPHVTEESLKGFGRVIPREQATALEAPLKPVPGKRGDLVIFDAFELHASMPNTTGNIRRALKIVVGDGLSEHLMPLADAEKGRFYRSMLRNQARAVRNRLVRSPSRRAAAY